MTNFAQVSKGIIYFIFGVGISVLCYWLMPAIINFLPTDTLKGIGWVGLIMVWFMTLIVAPGIAILKGIREEE